MLSPVGKATKAASKVISNCWMQKLPVPLVTIARKMGVPVFSGGISNFCESHLIDARPRILLNEDLPLFEKRFLLAHALGHVIMGHLSEEHRKIDCCGQSHLIDHTMISEIEADQFALCLLVPEVALVKHMHRDGSELAEMFKVTEEAIRHRLNLHDSSLQLEAEMPR